MDDSGLLRKTAGMGVAVLLLSLFMYLFALGRVTDTTDPELGLAVDRTLGARLMPGTKSRVGVREGLRDGKKRRDFNVRFEPAAGTAEGEGFAALCLDAANAVVSTFDVQEFTGDVSILCTARRGKEALHERSWTREPTPRGEWKLVERIPPAVPPGGGAGSDTKEGR